MPTERACKICRRLIKGTVCPVCKSSDLVKGWKGVLYVFDSTSEIAKEANLNSPGKFASKLK